MIEIAFLDKLDTKVPNQKPRFSMRDIRYQQFIEPSKVALAMCYPGELVNIKDDDTECVYNTAPTTILELVMDNGTTVYTVAEERVLAILKQPLAQMSSYGANQFPVISGTTGLDDGGNPTNEEEPSIEVDVAEKPSGSGEFYINLEPDEMVHCDTTERVVYDDETGE